MLITSGQLKVKQTIDMGCTDSRYLSPIGLLDALQKLKRIIQKSF